MTKFEYVGPGQQKTFEEAQCVICGRPTIRRYKWRSVSADKILVPICDAYKNKSVACYNAWLSPDTDMELLRKYPKMGEFIRQEYGIGLEWSKPGKLRMLRDRSQTRFKF